MRLHLFTLALHFGGSVLTFIALMIVFDVHRDFNDVLQLAGVIFGYFAVDSIFFHSTIERKYTVSDSKIEDSEILDDLQ